MSAIPQIGPRASLILGMLVGMPMTVEELHALIERVNGDPDLMGQIENAGHEWDTDLAIRTLAANRETLDDALDRLRELGMVDAIADPHGVVLWSARQTH